jgi:carbon-monoxide dehydrogenase small subunit
MIMAADSLIREADGPLDEAAVRIGLEGNLCRCTGYHNIVKSVVAASQEMRSDATSASGG